MIGNMTSHLQVWQNRYCSFHRNMMPIAKAKIRHVVLTWKTEPRGTAQKTQKQANCPVPYETHSLASIEHIYGRKRFWRFNVRREHSKNFLLFHWNKQPKMMLSMTKANKHKRCNSRTLINSGTWASRFIVTHSSTTMAAWSFSMFAYKPAFTSTIPCW